MSVRAGTGPSGLATVEIDGEFGAATIVLQGAHVISWVPRGHKEMLFVSRAARFGPGSSIRGGVPICFPQFAELGPLPKHGFAHVLPWQWSGDGDGAACFALRDSDATRALWPHRFAATLSVELGPSSLHLVFCVRNNDDAPWQWSGTLHTYLALDARNPALHGLGPAWFVDRGHNSRFTEDPDPVLRIPGHTDRVYLDAGPEVQVSDGRRGLIVGKTGFRDTVVWNPGPETVARFPDLEPQDHARFVCIEAAEVRPVTVAPGESWTGTQTLRRLGP